MVGITQRDPTLELLHQLEHRMGRIYNDSFRAFEWPVHEAATTAWQPLVDIFEEPDVIRLVAEVPGVKPEDVKITVIRIGPNSVRIGIDAPGSLNIVREELCFDDRGAAAVAAPGAEEAHRRLPH